MSLTSSLFPTVKGMQKKTEVVCGCNSFPVVYTLPVWLFFCAHNSGESALKKNVPPVLRVQHLLKEVRTVFGDVCFEGFAELHTSGNELLTVNTI